MFPRQSDVARPPADGGLVLGRYEPLGVIGRGGMGVVSRARDRRTGELVAIKQVRSERARAEREAMSAARLDHPAIVSLLHAEPTDDGWIIVSELVEGADLRAVLRAGAIPELDVARFAGSVLRGLAHAHARGVVHRDVKPANVLCPHDPRRAGAWAKLTDFGVAALAGAETLTAVGDVVGTMAYMAPEQARGERAGAPADVFALSVVIFEALAGVNPRRGSTAAETAHRAHASLPPLGRYRADLPAGIIEAIDGCLELDPADRGGLGDLDDGLRRLAAWASGRARSDRHGPQASTLPVRRSAPLGAPGPGSAIGVPAGRPFDPGSVLRDAGAPREPTGTVAFAPRGAGGPATEPWPPRRSPLAPHDAPAPGIRPHNPYGLHDPHGPGAWEGVPDGAAAPAGRLPSVPGRLLGTAGAAAALAVLTGGSVAALPLVGAALAAFVLPRLTWIGIAAAAVVLLATRDETAAALAAAAGLAPIALFPRRGGYWPGSGLAAGLAWTALPGAWPALAALAPTLLLRAALAAQGALAAAVVGTALGTAPLHVPTGDALELVAQFVLPLAGIWAVAAALLGTVVRGRTLLLDLAAAGAWCAAVGAAMVQAGVADPGALTWAGPAVAALVVVGIRAATRTRPS